MLRQFLIITAIHFALASVVFSQAPVGPGAPTSESIQAEAKSAAARSDLSDEVKKAVQQSYDAALAALDAAAASEAQASAFREALKTAAADAEAAAAEAATIVIPANPGDAVTEAEGKLELADRKALLAKEEAALAKAEAALAELDAALAAQTARPPAIEEESAQAQERERAALEELTALNGAAGPAEAAERTRLKAQLAATRARQAALDQERAGAPARESLLKAQRERQSRIVARGKARVAGLQALVKASVEDLATAAEKLAGEEPTPGTVAAEVKDYAADLRSVAGRIATARSAKEEQAAKLEKLQADHTLVVRQIEASGGSGTAAQILLDQSRGLPDPRRLRREQKTRSATSAEVRFERVKADAALERLKNDPPSKPGRPQELRDTKRALLEQLSEQYAQLIAELGKVDLVKRAYVEKLEEFTRLLNEKLFWVRSSPPLGMETFSQVPSALAWVAGPSRASRTIWALRSIMVRAPVQIGGFALLAVVLFFLRPWMRRRLAAHLPLIRRISADRYAFTLEALGLVLLVAVPFSLLMWVVGRQLLFIPEAGDWTQGIGQGILRASGVLASFMFLREMSRKDGLAETHFKWKQPVTSRLKRAATGFAWFYVPATVVLLMLFTEHTNQYMPSLGRLLFISAMIWVAAWSWYMLHPNRGIFADFIRKNETGFVARLRYLWFAAALLAPLALAGLAAWGYLVTALQLSSYMHGTAAIGVGAVIAYHLMLRYFTMRERKIALEHTLAERKARKEAAAEAAAKGDRAVPEDSGSGEEGPLPDPEQEAMDLAQVGVQTRRMLRAVVVSLALGGLWMVWSDALPALQGLDTTPLLGKATAADLILAALVGIATIVVAKNLPGILEIAVLRNLPMDSGSRYAMASLAQYIIVAIGLMIIFQVLPVDWSQFGWMVAALSVGLGFGLQEIVANFVCGIILLFERPIRVGDVVTVSGTTGTVSRIRMRATTITDWDRKELVVPNKAFITSEVLNWTLSNTTNRVVINIGVAYGTDTEKARELILKILGEHPNVSADPAPLVTFEKFGDSSLDFVVRAYLPSLERRAGVTHELYTEIHRRFNEAGIEIPFPQRDLHVRSGWGGAGGE